MVTATKAGNSFSLVTGSRGEHGGLEGQTIKDHKETFWGDVYVHFLDFDDGFMSVYNLIHYTYIYSKFIRLPTSYMCSLSYVNYTSK